MSPKANERWRYFGPGDWRGHVHTVTSVEKDLVMTWSDPHDKGSVGGMTWMGTPELFAKEFRRIKTS